MASENAPRDANHVPTVLLESSTNPGVVLAAKGDEITGRLLVDSASASGTVTSVSVVTANGVSGSVANPTTTPAITLTLGAITPSSVQISGLTISQIVATDASKNLVSLDTATYPSLTELSYVKGVTSAIQTQLNAKGSGTVTAVSIATANGFSGSSSGGATPALTIVAGAITPTTVNGLTITANGTNTLSITAGKTLSIVKTMSFTAADDTGVYTLPAGTKTLVATDVATLSSLTSVGSTLTVATGYQIGGAAASGKILKGNGTNFVASTETYAAPGASGNVMTSDGTNWTSAASSGGSTTAESVWSTSFEDTARFSSAVVSGGVVTFSTYGVQIDTSTTTTSSAYIRYDTAAFHAYPFFGSPTFKTNVYMAAKGATASSFFGIGNVTVGGTGHTYTVKHIGFKIVISASTASLYATQADGSTENASSALITVATDDTLELAFKVNGTSSVDYYYRQNNGSWSSA